MGRGWRTRWPAPPCCWPAPSCSPPSRQKTRSLGRSGRRRLTEREHQAIGPVEEGRGVARVHGGAVEASVEAGRRGGGQLALGSRQAGIGVVEDVLVGSCPGLQ